MKHRDSFLEGTLIGFGLGIVLVRIVDAIFEFIF